MAGGELGDWFWTCERVCVAVCFVRVCMRVLLGMFACLKEEEEEEKSTTKSRAVRRLSPRRSSGYGALMSVRRRARPKALRPADRLAPSSNRLVPSSYSLVPSSTV